MTELTAEMIVDREVAGDPNLSPDGQWVAYVLTPSSKREEHGTSALWIASVDGSQPPRPFTAGVAADRMPRWSPNGEAIAFLSDRADRGTAQLYLIPLAGGEAQALTPVSNKRGVQSFAWSPDGRTIAFSSPDEPSDEDKRREKERDDAQVYGERWPHARLRLLDLATGDIKTLVSVDRHVADFVWSPDGAELAYLLGHAPTIEWSTRETECQRIAVGGGEAQSVCRFNREVSGMAWAKDGRLLFLAPLSGKSQSAKGMWWVPSSGGEPSRLALGDEDDALDLAQPRDTARAGVVVARGLDTQLAWLDPTSGEVEVFYPTPSDEMGEIFSWSIQPLSNGGLALACVRSTGSQPWALWAGRREGTDGELLVKPITNHQSSLAEIKFGPQQPFYWTAPDGWELDGILILPPNAPPGPLPLVTLVHGGPYGRSGQGFHLNWADWAQWLATAGYAIFMPNYRGGYGHGERFASAARGDVGGAGWGDVMTGVDAVIERGIADPDRLGIGGWSQGGFMSAWAVTQTDRFKAAVIGAGVTDWGMLILTTDKPDFERELGGSAPWDGVGPHRHAELSPISFARNVKTPSLILHGQNDARVPVSQAIGFHRALRDIDATTELVIYPREPHGLGERAHQLDVLRRVRAWYDRWLKAS